MYPRASAVPNSIFNFSTSWSSGAPLGVVQKRLDMAEGRGGCGVLNGGLHLGL